MPSLSGDTQVPCVYPWLHAKKGKFIIGTKQSKLLHKRDIKDITLSSPCGKEQLVEKTFRIAVHPFLSAFAWRWFGRFGGTGTTART